MATIYSIYLTISFCFSSHKPIHESPNESNNRKRKQNSRSEKFGPSRQRLASRQETINGMQRSSLIWYV